MEEDGALTGEEMGGALTGEEIVGALVGINRASQLIREAGGVVPDHRALAGLAPVEALAVVAPAGSAPVAVDSALQGPELRQVSNPKYLPL